MDCHFLLQGIFPTQGSNPGLPHCRQRLYRLSSRTPEINSSLYISYQFSSIQSVQSLSRVQLFVTPWTAAGQASLSITNSRNLLKLMSIESVMPSNRPILCPPLLLLPSICPSISVFSYESVLRIRWPKYWSFSFNAEAEIQTLDGAKFSLQVASLLLTAFSLTGLGLHLRGNSSRERATLDLLLAHQGVF